jgi:hypothetical protein
MDRSRILRAWVVDFLRSTPLLWHIIQREISMQSRDTSSKLGRPSPWVAFLSSRSTTSVKCNPKTANGPAQFQMEVLAHQF